MGKGEGENSKNELSDPRNPYSDINNVELETKSEQLKLDRYGVRRGRGRRKRIPRMNSTACKSQTEKGNNF